MHATSLSARSLILLLAGGALAGCTYHSSYVPPNDGRARLVWDGSGVVEHLPDADSTCVATVDKLRNGEGQAAMALSNHPRWWQPEDEEIAEDPGPEPSDSPEWSTVDSGGGDSSPHATHGRTRHHGHHARGYRGGRSGGRGAVHVSSGSRGGHGGRTFAGPRFGRGGHGSASKSGGGKSGGGGGGGGGKGAGAAAVALIVLAYAIMPIAAIVWAESPPESSGVGVSIDSVHAFNDLARSGSADCGGDR